MAGSRTVVRRAALGAAAGVAATFPMTLVMLLAQRLGLMGDQPPERITQAALQTLDVRVPKNEERGLSLVNHLGFGAACGALYTLVRGEQPRPHAPFMSGIAYGLTIWWVSYEGWLPALRVLPKIESDRPGRPQSMAAAHMVFGATLAALLRRLRQ